MGFPDRNGTGRRSQPRDYREPVAWSETEVDTPTFARELAELMASHRALWLAEALPAGPLLLWAAGRTLAATLCADPRRTVVLLEPSEAAAAAAMRQGAPGLRTVHVADGHAAASDLEEMGLSGFVGAVVVPGSPAELDAVLPLLAQRCLPDSAICIVIAPDDAERAAQALREIGRTDAATLHQRSTACSHIERALGSARSTLREARSAGDPEVALVASGLRTGAGDAGDVLLGHDVGVSAWRTGVDQMAATVALLDQVVDERNTSRLRELEGALALAQQRSADAQRSAEEWEAQVDLLHRSTSWRLTAPLRRITALARSK